MKSCLGNEKGIALLLTLVVLVLLVAVIVEFDYGTKVNLVTAGNFRDDVRATYLAKSGVTAARAVLKDDLKRPESAKYDALTEFWAQPFPPYPVGEGFVSVEITDEAGKIDLNRLGAKDATVRDGAQEMLKRLLRVLELDSNMINPIVMAIRDWVDSDDDDEFYGAEDIYYQRLDPPYHCKNGPMDTLSELLLVKGVTPEIYRKVRPYLTTVRNGLININTAELPVLQALHDDIAHDVAVCMQNNRPYETATSEHFFGCGLASSACQVASSCRGQIGVKSNYFTVKSHGIMHETEKIITAMIQRKGDKMELLSWHIE